MLFNIPVFASAATILLPIVSAWPRAIVEPRQDTNQTSPEEIGTPAPNPPQPSNSTVGGVLFCQDVDWTNCSFTVLPLNTCLDMTQTWNQSISSIGPNNGTVLLTYREDNCEGNGTGWLYPGSSSLIVDGWNDNIASAKAMAETFQT